MRTGERIERRVVPSARMDDVAERLQRTVERVLRRPGGGRLIDALHGTWLGHPLHPSLTDVPIGFWMAACAVDSVDAARGREDEGLGTADGLALVGVAGALAAAGSGAADWSRAGSTGSRVGLVHAVVNVLATALVGASVVVRRPGRARALRLAGMGLTAFGGWLGGKLVFGASLGVDHTAWEQGPEDWTDVGALEELPEGRLVRAQAGGLPVALLWTGGEGGQARIGLRPTGPGIAPLRSANSLVLAIGDTCSHLGGPLSEGELDGEVVTCPWHGSRFCMRDGSVRGGPATFPQPQLETRLEAGRVQVREILPGAPLP